MRRLFISLIITIATLSVSAQHVFRRVASFPADLNELSGMVFIENKFYMLNDGGNSPRLYQTDTNGRILQTLIVNGINEDWEELTQYGDSLLYIGDFGNNDNSRRNLKILKLNLNQRSGDTLHPEEIQFTYEDQSAFPPASSKLQYDCEAMIYLNDSLHLFSKNRTSPFNGYTRHYSMPAIPGNQVARLVDSVYTGGFLKELFWVTGAALSSDKKQLALLSSDKVYLFSEFSGSDFFRGKMRTIALGDISQKEAICFSHSRELWIGDEANSLNSAGLYVLLTDTAETSGIKNNQTQVPNVEYYKDTRTIKFSFQGKLISAVVYGADGRKICHYDLSGGISEYSVQSWPSGHYFCEISSETKKYFCVFRKF